MVAVLPLENLTGDPAQDYFSDGMTEELITELGRLGTPRLGVIARSSVMAYKGTRKPVKDVGHELGVDYVIEGSLRQEGERVRITIHLIRVADATQVWAESYERNLASVLSVQQSVARNVADLVRIELPPDAQRHLAEVRRVNPEAYKLYLRGRHAWRQRTPADVRKALEYFEHAVALDPGFALAYVGIADCYTLEGGSYLGAPPRKARAFAIQAVRKALALDDSLAEAHATLAESLYYGEWDWAGAEREFRRALELNPNYPTAHQWYSEFLSMAGRHDQAIAEMKLARTLDPHSSIIHASLGWSYYHARRYDDAIRECQQVLSVTPDLGTAQVCLSVALYDSGRHRQAFEETLKHNGLQSDLELRKQWQAAYERGGWPAVWAQTWDRMSKQKAIGEEVEFYDLAEIALRLDRRDEALRLLEQAAEQREENLVQIRAYAAFYPLENDPRFHQLLARVNFPER
jgi:TolB-like protein/Tfp pilus assembly protein PilF